jgi:3-deoxy-D-arabino-heptulosonate 7-phosphate (DAHP) synthase class II
MNEELGGYDNVYVHRNLEVGNVESLQDLQKVEPSQDANGDVLDALVVALDVLRKNTMDKKKCTRRVFLVTGGECLAEDDEQAEEITSQFNAMETKLDVVYVES